jgi:DNA-binding phage protein
MRGKVKKGRIGSSLGNFLIEEGLQEETTAVAINRVLAWELEQATNKEGLTTNEIARRARTSRSQLDRMLDPKNGRIQLDTLLKAARALGGQVQPELVQEA